MLISTYPTFCIRILPWSNFRTIRSNALLLPGFKSVLPLFLSYGIILTCSFSPDLRSHTITEILNIWSGVKYHKGKMLIAEGWWQINTIYNQLYAKTALEYTRTVHRFWLPVILIWNYLLIEKFQFSSYSKAKSALCNVSSFPFI